MVVLTPKEKLVDRDWLRMGQNEWRGVAAALMRCCEAQAVEADDAVCVC